MIEKDRFSQLLQAANASFKDADIHRQTGNGPPRFELFHFALSLCSQKVRACLAEKRAGYLAHDINVQLPLLGNYDPGYVRLRLEGVEGAGFAREYTGRSSVATQGFDPAVVPTLVDLEAAAIVTDSLRICRYIDDAVEPAGALVPNGLAGFVDQELDIVDQTPHVALLYGAHPDIDFRTERLRKGMVGVHDRKIAKLRIARDLASDDPALCAAYEAKIAKEKAGRQFVSTPELMKKSINETLRIIEGLETRLDDGRDWIAGDKFTLADSFWAVSLFRLKWLGMGFAWEGAHALNNRKQQSVAAYASRLFRRPAFRSAVIDWPGTPRSEFVTEHYSS